MIHTGLTVVYEHSGISRIEPVLALQQVSKTFAIGYRIDLQETSQTFFFEEARPEGVFTTAYSQFALLVAATLVLAPPRWPGKRPSSSDGSSEARPGASS